MISQANLRPGHASWLSTIRSKPFAPLFTYQSRSSMPDAPINGIIPPFTHRLKKCFVPAQGATRSGRNRKASQLMRPKRPGRHSFGNSFRARPNNHSFATCHGERSEPSGLRTARRSQIANAQDDKNQSAIPVGSTPADTSRAFDTGGGAACWHRGRPLWSLSRRPTERCDRASAKAFRAGSYSSSDGSIRYRR